MAAESGAAARKVIGDIFEEVAAGEETLQLPEASDMKERLAAADFSQKKSSSVQRTR